MKKLFFVFMICLVYAISPVQAQDGNARDGVSYSVIRLDYYSPFVDDFSLQNDFITTGVMIGYHRNLVKNFLNLEIPVKIGGVRVFDNANTSGRKKALIGMDALLQLQYNTGSNLLVPYLSAGLGGNHIDDDGGDFQVPAGLGLDLRLGKGIYFRTRAEYRFSFSDNRDAWNYIFGLKALLGGSPKEDKPVEIVPTDRDGDGITDNKDKCPDVAGLAALEGCPDGDGDGVADADDECPTVAGLPKYSGCPDTDNDGIVDGKDDCPNEAGPASNNGCPVKDSDGDGVTDDIDDCPNEKGLAKNSGCPDTDNDGILDKDDACPELSGLAKYNGCPDTDGDGVIDTKDKCPKTAGPASNQGCPELEEKEKEVLTFAAQAIQFNTGSAVIKPESYTILNQVADILNKYPGYKCAIDGHTDSVGNEESNQVLSGKRAKACYDFLISRGVDATRLTYAGYGESQPVGDNKYAAGRAQNRRVEFNISL